MPQRRKYFRFEVEAPVIFCWKSGEGDQVAEGMTVDISAGGVYISASKCPPERSVIRYQVLLPTLEEDAGPNAHMVANAIGRIIRRSDLPGGGFALRHRAMVLRDEKVEGDKWKQFAFRSPPRAA